MSPPPQLLPLLHNLKNIYFLWFTYYQKLPKIHRYSLGERIDSLFVELLEMTTVASFTPKAEKIPYVKIAIRKLDTIKILLMVLWETKSIDDKKYLALSKKLEGMGKILGGWYGKLFKENSPVA